MKIIGVTGGLGAGKTTVSGILKELGAMVIDADQISREVTEPGKPAWKEIIENFGREVLQPDKTLDRKALARIVFRNEEKKKLLEGIIHDRVTMEMRKRIRALKADGFEGVVVLDVPIPVQSGFIDLADSIWVVTCRDEERIRRVMRRSGMDYADARNRINSQIPQSDYVRLADVVIENEGSPESLRQRVAELWNGL
jgi:dephospho-CoA kinase